MLGNLFDSIFSLNSDKVDKDIKAKVKTEGKDVEEIMRQYRKAVSDQKDQKTLNKLESQYIEKYIAYQTSVNGEQIKT